MSLRISSLRSRLSTLWSNCIATGVDLASESPLSKLRARFINIYMLYFIFGTMVLMVQRLFIANYFAVLVNGVLLVMLLSTFYLSKIGRHQLALNLVNHYLLALGILALYYGSFLQLVLCAACIPTSSAFLSNRSSWIPFYYYLLCMGLFLFFNARNNIGGATSFILFVTVTFLMASRFINFLEHTYDDLLASVREKNKVLDNLEESNRELVLFTDIMTHDLRAPLGTIGSFSKLVQEKCAQGDQKTLEYLQIISKSVSSMDSLIGDLLNYSRAGKVDLELTDVDLNEIVHQVTSQIKTDPRTSDTILNTDKLPTILGRSNSLLALFQNLFSNALKFQPKNNPLHIPKIEIRYTSSDDWHSILFSDNGIGIPVEFAGDVFKPFKKFHSVSEYEGTGLGMSICRKVVIRHGGDISLEPCEEGTTIRILLPRTSVDPHLLPNESSDATPT